MGRRVPLSRAVLHVVPAGPGPAGPIEILKALKTLKGRP